MSRTRSLILSLSLLLAPACGFHPVHAKMNNDLSRELASVQITDIPGREGQIVKYKLADLLNPDGLGSYPTYKLDIAIQEQKNEMGIQEDLRVTRYDIVMTANYKLTSLATGQTIHSGSAHIKSSFNRTASEFSTFVAEEDSEEIAAAELAQELKQRLTAYFSK